MKLVKVILSCAIGLTAFSSQAVLLDSVQADMSYNVQAASVFSLDWKPATLKAGLITDGTPLGVMNLKYDGAGADLFITSNHVYVTAGNKPAHMGPDGNVRAFRFNNASVQWHPGTSKYVIDNTASMGQLREINLNMVHDGDNHFIPGKYEGMMTVEAHSR